MARNRPGFDSEHSNQFVLSPNKNPPAPVHITPRKGQFSGPISSELHRSPVAVNVSPSGERTIHPIDNASYINDNVPSHYENNGTNPFASESDALDLACKSLEETFSKSNGKMKAHSINIKARTKKRKDRRTTPIFNLTQRNNQRTESSQKEVQDASVQTDSPIAAINRSVDDIGDARKPVEGFCQEVSLSSKTEQKSLTLFNKKLESIDTILLQFIPENIRMLTSFLIMIILIFWLTSIILDVEVPSDFWRIATSYVQSFKWNYFYKQPQTNTEKYWEFLTKLFN